MDDSSWLSRDELRTFRAFDRAWRALEAQLDNDLERDVGLPRTYFEILWRLRRAPGHSKRMSDLTDETGSKASRMSYPIGRLETDGLVRREHVEFDRRGWMAVLTDEGLLTAEMAGPRFARGVREHFLDLLSPTMRDQLTAIGETVLRELNTEKHTGAQPESTREEDA